MDKSSEQIFKRALQRERAARKEAEAILEQKSLELFELNEELKATNVTLKKLNQKQSSQLKGVFYSLVDAYILIDIKGDVVEMNKAAVDLFGYDVEKEKLNVTWLIYPKDYKYAINAYRKLLSSGTFKDYSARVYTKTKVLKRVHINASLVYENTGKAIAAQGIVRDITQEYREKKIKKQLLADLKKSNEELNDFAHVISHDLKSPLRSMNTLIYWLQEDYSSVLDDNVKDILNKISLKVTKMDALIKGVLQYSRVDKIIQPKEQISILELVNDIVKVIFIPKHVTVLVQDKLPIITGDKFRLQQLFQNLINNAVSYIDKEKGIVKIDYSETEKFWQFSIEDNGIGIEEKYQKKIFEVFQSLKKSEHSTGIGLSIVKKIVHYFGGKIWLNSTVGKGTTFYFTIKKC